MAMKFLQAINNYLFVRQAKQYISETERERRFVSYDKAKSVLILFESDFTENLKKTAEATEESIKLTKANIDNKEVQTRIAQFQPRERQYSF